MRKRIGRRREFERHHADQSKKTGSRLCTIFKSFLHCPPDTATLKLELHHLDEVAHGVIVFNLETQGVDVEIVGASDVVDKQGSSIDTHGTKPTLRTGALDWSALGQAIRPALDVACLYVFKFRLNIEQGKEHLWLSKWESWVRRAAWARRL